MERGASVLLERPAAPFLERPPADIQGLFGHGYQPDIDYGVRVNITPLAQARLLPRVVLKKLGGLNHEKDLPQLPCRMFARLPSNSDRRGMPQNYRTNALRRDILNTMSAAVARVLPDEGPEEVPPGFELIGGQLVEKQTSGEHSHAQAKLAEKVGPYHRRPGDRRAVRGAGGSAPKPSSTSVRIIISALTWPAGAGSACRSCPQGRW